MIMKIGYLGPEGTYCEQAAQKYGIDEPGNLIPYSNIELVFAAVQTGETDIGIVPIENSCEGAVNLTLDLLAYEYDLKIVGEVVIKIRHHLLARPGWSKEQVRTVFSHPQALAQCRKYLSQNFSGVELREVSSTARAAQLIAANPDQPWAALATKNAARVYGLDILDENTNDLDTNETRFIALGQNAAICLQNCKTSLLFSVINRPGALFDVLREFADQNINLTKIESRPAKTKIGDYMFFIDIEGSLAEERIQKALEQIKSSTQEILILGSYPTYRSFDA